MTTLRFAHLVPNVWAALESEERQGRVRSGILEPETVAEHTLDMLRIGEEVAREAGLSEQETEDLLSMLEIHDWPEAIDGDEVTMHGVDPEKEADQKRVKYLREDAAMVQICASFGEEGQRLLALWRRFETNDDPIATLAREIDKYQAIEQAFRYERSEQGPEGLGDEFLRYSPQMTHPLLIKRVASLVST